MCENDRLGIEATPLAFRQDEIEPDTSQYMSKGLYTNHCHFMWISIDEG